MFWPLPPGVWLRTGVHCLLPPPCPLALWGHHRGCSTSSAYAASANGARGFLRGRNASPSGSVGQISSPLKRMCSQPSGATWASESSDSTSSWERSAATARVKYRGSRSLLLRGEAVRSLHLLYVADKGYELKGSDIQSSGQHVAGDPWVRATAAGRQRRSAAMRSGERRSLTVSDRGIQIIAAAYLDGIGFFIFPVPEVPVTQG